ncbi:MAG: thioredoxin domain-containing protein [Polyangiaceae bacterium]|nr:thioredoxin domain-containing protein [Polyangiaceae bacterium]
MKHNAWSRWAAALGAVSLAATFAISFAGCKPRVGAPKAVASKDGGADAGKPKGPCEKYADKLCEKAGDKSSACTSLKSAAELFPPQACTVALRNVGYATKKIAEQRKKCDELTTNLCKDIGKDTETCAMVMKQTKNFPPERCAMMMKRYDQVLRDLKRREAANKPLDAQKQAAIAAADAPSFGPANAKVTIVEFSDFQCPFCSRAADTLHKIKQKYADKVRFVFRQFPLSFHSNAKAAAAASLAANAQGKFWQMHEIMFKNQQKLDAESLKGFAKQIGLDTAAWEKALTDKKITDAIDADMKLGREIGIQGTPSLFLNGARISNPTDFGAVEKAIDKALAK